MSKESNKLMMKTGLWAVLAASLTMQAVADDKQPAVKTVVPAAAAAAKKDAAPTKEEVSYAVGVYFANQMKSAEYEFSTDEINKGMKDTLAGSPKINEMQLKETMQKWQMDNRTRMEEKRRKEGADNLKKAEEFLALNGKKPGIKTSPKGVQYEVIKEGLGKTPTAEDTVSVNYVGTLISGKEFDKNNGATFPVRGVIPGWTETLQMMKVGSKWKLFIPPGLAYGENSPPSIPANSLLIFEVELLDAKSPAAQAKPEGGVQAVSGEIIKVPSQEEMKKGAKPEVLKEEDVKKIIKENEGKKAPEKK